MKSNILLRTRHLPPTKQPDTIHQIINNSRERAKKTLSRSEILTSSLIPQKNSIRTLLKPINTPKSSTNLKKQFTPEPQAKRHKIKETEIIESYENRKKIFIKQKHSENIMQKISFIKLKPRSTREKTQTQLKNKILSAIYT